MASRPPAALDTDENQESFQASISETTVKKVFDSMHLLHESKGAKCICFVAYMQSSFAIYNSSL